MSKLHQWWRRWRSKFRRHGTHPQDGLGTRLVFTVTRATGGRIPETGTSAVSSSPSLRGKGYTVEGYLRMPPGGSSYIGPGWFGFSGDGSTTGQPPQGPAA